MKLLSTLLLLLTLKAQAGDTLFWNKNILSFKATHTISGEFEYGTRHDLTKSQPLRNYVRSTWMSLIHKSFKIGGGLVYSGNDNALSQHDETRVFQKVQWSTHLASVLTSLTYRIEERFFRMPQKETQIRHRLKWLIVPPIPAPLSGHWLLYDEVFSILDRTSASLPQTGYAQNRFFVGLWLPLSQRLSGQWGYLSQSIPHTTGEKHHNNIAVFNLYYSYHQSSEDD